MGGRGPGAVSWLTAFLTLGLADVALAQADGAGPEPEREAAPTLACPWGEIAVGLRAYEASADPAAPRPLGDVGLVCAARRVSAESTDDTALCPLHYNLTGVRLPAFRPIAGWVGVCTPEPGQRARRARVGVLPPEPSGPQLIAVGGVATSDGFAAERSCPAGAVLVGVEAAGEGDAADVALSCVPLEPNDVDPATDAPSCRDLLQRTLFSRDFGLRLSADAGWRVAASGVSLLREEPGWVYGRAGALPGSGDEVFGCAGETLVWARTRYGRYVEGGGGEWFDPPLPVLHLPVTGPAEWEWAGTWRVEVWGGALSLPATATVSMGAPEVVEIEGRLRRVVTLDVRVEAGGTWRQVDRVTVSPTFELIERRIYDSTDPAAEPVQHWSTRELTGPRSRPGEEP